MHFYYIRHGQTPANEQGVMCGSGLDVPLTELGREQARGAARILQAQAPDIEAFLVSPLQRARQTAEILAQSFPAVQIHYLDNLKEWAMGSWEGVPYTSVKELFHGQGEPENGETREQFRTRVRLVLDECLLRPEKFLIVGHGAVWMMAQEILGLTSAKTGNCIPHKVFRKTASVWHTHPLE